jgi:hypothetical protein
MTHSRKGSGIPRLNSRKRRRNRISLELNLLEESKEKTLQEEKEVVGQDALASQEEENKDG